MGFFDYFIVVHYDYTITRVLENYEKKIINICTFILLCSDSIVVTSANKCVTVLVILCSVIIRRKSTFDVPT